MREVLEALRDQTQRICAAVEAGDDDALEAVLAERERGLKAFAAALRGGDDVSRADAEELLRLDRRANELVDQRRRALWQCLAARRTGRSAARAYGDAAQASAVFVDRAA